MLNFLFGTDTEGKRKYVSEKISSLIDDGRRVFLIVPEQSSFDRDREFLFAYGEQKSNRLTVSSFTHFSADILEESSVAVKPRSDDTARAVLMSLAVREASDGLKLYGKYSGRQECISRLMQMYEGIKQSGLSANDLKTVSGKLNGTLRQKTEELSLIFSLYEAFLSLRFSNPADNLKNAASVLAETDNYSDAVFFFDGFRGFTGAQIKFMSVLMTKCSEFYVSVTAHDFADSERNSAFEHALKNAGKIKREADKNNIRVSETKTDVFREESETDVLKNSLFSNEPDIYEKAVEDVKIIRAADVYSECELAALEIKRLINAGVRCRDIAVFERGSAYAGILIPVLKKYNIPVFEDKRRPFYEYPLVRLIISAVEVASGCFDTEKILASIKTGLFGITEDECSEIENYVYCWNINYGKWEQEFKYNPDGFGCEFTDEAKETLNRLNSIRERIITPLSALREQLKKCNGETSCRSVFEFLERVNASQNFLEYARFLNDTGNESEALECGRVWDSCTESLDSLNSALDGRKISPNEFYSLLKLMLCSQTLGDIPAGIDEIVIGAADRMRFLSPYAVVVLGVNDGVFPRQSVPTGLFTPKEERILADNGFELDGMPETKFAEERLIAFDALTCTAKKLVLCYSEMSKTGEKLFESEIIKEVKTIFPQIRETTAEDYTDEERMCTPRAAFEEYAHAENKNTEYCISLREAIKENGEFAGNIACLDRAVSKIPIGFTDKDVSLKLFGENLHMSASQMETYSICPFKYFCRYGMRVEPKKTAMLDRRINGLLVHKVMEDIFGSFTKDEISKMSEDDIKRHINGFTKAYVSENMGEENTLPASVLRDIDRSKEDMNIIMQRFISEFGNCRFVTCNVELKIGGENYDIPAYRLTLPDGGSVTVTGSIDRVDIMELADKKYVRILDYKTGGKVFKLADIYDGLNMQMLIYLFALCKNGKKLFGDVIPAGILYIPAKKGENIKDRRADTDKVFAKKIENGRMNGLLLEDENVIMGMEAEARGIYIDTKIDDNGVIKGTTLTLDEFNLLGDKIDKILTETAVNIHNGIIAALPYSEEKCENCDYSNVCLRKSGDPLKAIHGYDKKTAREMLGREDEDDGKMD